MQLPLKMQVKATKYNIWEKRFQVLTYFKAKPIMTFMVVAHVREMPYTSLTWKSYRVLKVRKWTILTPFPCLNKSSNSESMKVKIWKISNPLLNNEKRTLNTDICHAPILVCDNYSTQVVTKYKATSNSK